MSFCRALRQGCCVLVLVALCFGRTQAAGADSDAATTTKLTRSAGAGASTVASQWEALWNFCLNLVTYASLLIPAYFAINWLQNSPRLTHGPFMYSKLLRSCVSGLEEPNGAGSLEEGAGAAGSGSDSSAAALRNARLARLKNLETSIPASVRLTICAVGLQISYVTWGVLQERIMTQSYGGEAAGDGSTAERFTNSQFLVLVNRILAFVVACVAVTIIPHPAHATPLYKYSFCSISNILSSWCQYEALKFVSFPTQVVFKSCKVIPVMLMGKVVSRRTYAWYEYAVAVFISIGVSIFLLSDIGANGSKKVGSATTFAGVIILAGYLTFDSFTSNWQKSLFDQYKVSPLQMMMGVNLFSCLFTTASLVQRGQLLPSLAFLQRHPEALYNITLLSAFSAVGQLFIYYTVRTFGPLTFTIIMTTRQLISIITSCIVYHHVIMPLGVVGAGIAFTAVFTQAYIKSRASSSAKAAKHKQPSAGPSEPTKGANS